MKSQLFVKLYKVDERVRQGTEGHESPVLRYRVALVRLERYSFLASSFLMPSSIQERMSVW